MCRACYAVTLLTIFRGKTRYLRNTKPHVLAVAVAGRKIVVSLAVGGARQGFADVNKDMAAVTGTAAMLRAIHINTGE